MEEDMCKLLWNNPLVHCVNYILIGLIKKLAGQDKG